MATFTVLIPCTLDGIDYQPGDTFEAHDNLSDHFESRGIAKIGIIEAPSIEVEAPSIEVEAPKPVKQPKK